MQNLAEVVARGWATNSWEFGNIIRNNAEGLTRLSFLPFFFERARAHICKSSLEFLLAPSKHTLGDPDHSNNWKSQHTLRSFICVLGMHTVAELPWQTRWCFCTSWVTAGLSKMRESLSDTKGSCENCWWADLCAMAVRIWSHLDHQLWWPELWWHSFCHGPFQTHRVYTTTKFVV